MIWPSERQKDSLLDLSPLPKLYVFAANSSFGAAPAYEQTLQALGWDYYLFGGELARQYPGACVRARTLEVLCSVMHEQQVRAVRVVFSACQCVSVRVSACQCGGRGQP